VNRFRYEADIPNTPFAENFKATDVRGNFVAGALQELYRAGHLSPRAPLRRALTKPPRAAGMTSPSTPSQPHRPNRALPDANIIYSIRGYDASYAIISYSRPGAAAGAPGWAIQAGSGTSPTGPDLHPVEICIAQGVIEAGDIAAGVPAGTNTPQGQASAFHGLGISGDRTRRGEDH
jgi:hypothetical protein